jgi:hypothetical protein
VIAVYLHIQSLIWSFWPCWTWNTIIQSQPPE